MIILPVGTLPDLTHPLMRGLVTWFACNEAGGAHLNNLGNPNNPGTFVGYDEGMWEDRGLLFNGTDQRVDFTPTSLTDAFTIAFWYRMDSTSNQTLVGADSNNYDYCVAYLSSRLYIRSTSHYRDSGIFPTAYKTGWHHMIIERNPGGSGVGKMFIDGGLYYSFSAFGGNIEADSFGAEPSSTEWFDGGIRDFRQWDRVLTEAERAELLKGTLTPLRRVATPVYTFGVAGGGGVNLIIADSAHGHTADNLVLTQAHHLGVDDAYSAHKSDEIVLQAAAELGINRADHEFSADNLVLTQANILVLQDSAHAHTADNVVLQSAGTLEIAGGLHANTANNIDLTQAHILAIADAAHAHAADNVTLDSSAIVVIQNSTLAHAADSLALNQAHVLDIAGALHVHLADNINIGVDHATLIISDALHAHLADKCNVSEQITVIETPGERIFMIQADGRVIAVSAGPRAFPIQ